MNFTLVFLFSKQKAQSGLNIIAKDFKNTIVYFWIVALFQFMAIFVTE